MDAAHMGMRKPGKSKRLDLIRGDRLFGTK